MFTQVPPDLRLAPLAVNFLFHMWKQINVLVFVSMSVALCANKIFSLFNRINGSPQQICKRGFIFSTELLLGESRQAK